MYKIISTLNGYNDNDLPIDAFRLHNIFNWYIPAIKHCKKLNPYCEIHILTDLDFGNILDGIEDVYIHLVDNKNNIVDYLRKNYIHLSPNPHHMEFNSIIRFVHLRNFCVENKIDEFLYLEPDVLVFSNVLEDRDYMKSMNYDMTLMLEKCAGVCFFRNGINVLNKICDVMTNSYSHPQKEPSAFDMEFYKKSSEDGYKYGGVSDMHFWNWYSNNHDNVLKNMDKNDNNVFWHTCIIRNSDDSEISLNNWDNELNPLINRQIKSIKTVEGKCYGKYLNNEVRIKYLHFNENTKKIIPYYIK